MSTTYRLIFIADKIPDPQNQIKGMKTFFYAIMQSYKKHLIFGGHFEFFTYNGYSDIFYFTFNELLDPETWIKS